MKKRYLNVARIRKQTGAHETTTSEPAVMTGFDRAHNQAVTMKQDYGDALQTHPSHKKGVENSQGESSWISITA